MTAIPHEVAADIRAVVFGPPEGGQEELNAAVERLRRLVDPLVETPRTRLLRHADYLDRQGRRSLADDLRTVLGQGGLPDGNRLKVAVCEYLLSVNRDHDAGGGRQFIPPTAIDWLGNDIVAVALGVAAATPEGPGPGVCTCPPAAHCQEVER